MNYTVINANPFTFKIDDVISVAYGTVVTVHDTVWDGEAVDFDIVIEFQDNADEEIIKDIAKVYVNSIFNQCLENFSKQSSSND